MTTEGNETIELELRLFATFREAVGQKTITRKYPDSVTVGEVLVALEDEFEDLDGQLLDEEGDIQPQLNVLKNGKEVLHLDGLDETFAVGDRLSLFPPVAGG